LKPINNNADPKALEVTGLSLESLAKTGLAPEAAMKGFGMWLSEIVPADHVPVFVGFNAPFDWSFINYYFHKFTRANPFGFSALDIKAYYMGAAGCGWVDTRSSAMDAVLKPSKRGDHNALHDAQYQAELFRLARNIIRARS